MKDSRTRSNALPIAVDLDNVVAESDSRIRKVIYRLSGVAISLPEMTSYSYFEVLVNKGVPPARARQIEAEALRLYNDIGCADAGLLEGAAEGLAKLLEAGLSLVYATSRPTSTAKLTETWLKDAGLPPCDVVYLEQKELGAPAWALLVDDAPHHAAAVSEAGVPVCLLDYPWNRSLPPHPLIHRAANWPEIVRLIFHLTRGG